MRILRALKAKAAITAGVTAMAVLTACGASPSSTGTTTTSSTPPYAAATVVVRNIAFNPKSVTVRAGQTVEWTFDDGGIAHNVAGSNWRSPDQTGGTYTHTFATPGNYSYRCTLHAAMTGEVVVTP